MKKTMFIAKISFARENIYKKANSRALRDF
jgi:hypothetical protein